MASKLSTFPSRPNTVNQSTVVSDKTRPFVVANGYSSAQQRVLATSIDDVETEINFKAYDNMENDSTITKVKRILITSVLADELQLAPGATEDEVDKTEFKVYTEIMEFCERIIDGLDKPYRDTLEQFLGNSVRYGHGIAETEWEYRIDTPSPHRESENRQSNKSKGTIGAAMSKLTAWVGSGFHPESVAAEGKRLPAVFGEKTRLMPSSVKVKPRNSAKFVVDDFMNVLGLVPANKTKVGLRPEDIVDRDKFMVLTMNKQDEDPRGRSLYRSSVNWYNLKTQIPSEMMRYILEESVPKAVGTLPKDMPPFEFERDENGNVVYEDPDTKQIPKMLTGAESFKRQIEGFRSGSGAVIPYEAKLEPYRKGLTGTGDADIWAKLLKVTNNAIEESVLLQTLAQSEGEHQARSAAQQVAEVLYNLVFWTRWQLAMTTLFDLFSVAVKVNFGEKYLKYLPMVSLGDFIRRDWAKEVEVLSDSYFKGFIDDTQRAELMSWLNLPKPGPSRQEVMQQAVSKTDVNGNPARPNSDRPDKSAGDSRNEGNGTEKKNNDAKNFGRSSINSMGNDSRWFSRFKSGIRASR